MWSACGIAIKGGMNATLPLMVFSDLDGTLIDHHSYTWAPAQQAIAALKQIGAAVVLASSKTAFEIDILRAEMGLTQWPAIVENGAGMLAANTAPDEGAGDYDALRAILADVPDALRRQFTGFGDMTPQEVSKHTGLAEDSAVLARKRAFSEPGLWQGTDDAKEEFLTALAAQGVRAQQGGRFLTLSFGATKADQMGVLKERYQPRTTIALGDAPNDVDMLENADFGVVVANPTRAPLGVLKGEAEGRIMRTKDAGPTGWNRAVMDVIARLNLNKD